jgi:hypothetical protein
MFMLLFHVFWLMDQISLFLVLFAVWSLVEMNEAHLVASSFGML